MSGNQDERTEAPTTRRRRAAREQGLGPRSQDLVVGCRMIGAAVGLQLFGEALALRIAETLQGAFQSPLRAVPSESDLVDRLGHDLMQLAWPCLGILVSAAVASLAVQLWQSGFQWRPGLLAPDLTRVGFEPGIARLNPLSNLSRLTSGTAKLVVLGLIGACALWWRTADVLTLGELDAGQLAERLGQTTIAVTWQVAGIALGLGLVDYGWQVWKFEQSLRMTIPDVREELRQHEGNPAWKERRREISRQNSAESVRI